tara:strand:+ start:47 stop:544 length:498 start_codon:yes stop_codon:yes gene_type:complete
MAEEEKGPLDAVKDILASGRSSLAKLLGFADSSIDSVKYKSIALNDDKDAVHHSLTQRVHVPFVEEWLAARHKQIYETSEYLNNRYKFSSSLARSHQMQYVATIGLGFGTLFGAMAMRVVPGGGFRGFRKSLFCSGLGAYCHSEVIQYKWKNTAPIAPKKATIQK